MNPPPNTDWERVRAIANDVIRYAPRINSRELQREVTRIIAMENARDAKKSARP